MEDTYTVVWCRDCNHSEIAGADCLCDYLYEEDYLYVCPRCGSEHMSIEAGRKAKECW